MHGPNQYTKLISRLMGDPQASLILADQLVESDNDPFSFYEKYKEKYFHKRGISQAGNDEQTLCYLLGVLSEKNLVYELGWKADSNELNHALRVLSKGRINENLFTVEDEEDGDGMYELLDMAEELLGEYGLSLVSFPLESDSHPIALVSIEQKEEVQALIDDLF